MGAYRLTDEALVAETIADGSGAYKVNPLRSCYSINQQNSQEYNLHYYESIRINRRTS